jgi:ATP-dependent Clp protease ATP-binding subunit ClpC
MGARPLRRAIQRYIEDPLADAVLRQGEMAPGSTVMVSKLDTYDPDKPDDPDAPNEPLKLDIIKPKKPLPPAPEPEKVGVGAKGDGEDGAGDEPGDAEPSPSE